MSYNRRELNNRTARRSCGTGGGMGGESPREGHCDARPDGISQVRNALLLGFRHSRSRSTKCYLRTTCFGRALLFCARLGMAVRLFSSRSRTRRRAAAFHRQVGGVCRPRPPHLNMCGITQEGCYSGIAAEIDTKNMPLAYFLNVSTPFAAPHS